MPCPTTSMNESVEAPPASGDLRDAETVSDLTRMATLGTLACMLAHEMNNLLTPVLNYARMALDAPADSRIGRRAHENAIQSVEACNVMAESILGFAREGQEGPASVPESVDQAIRCLPRDLAKDGVELELDVDDSLSADIAPTALAQIVLNLALNARQAMPAGGRLAISAGRSTWNTGENRVTLRVADTGCGIEGDTLERIFEPFVSGGRGFGLGLTICRRLLDEVDGRIRVASTVGEGSVFEVDLPAARTGERTAAA